MATTLRGPTHVVMARTPLRASLLPSVVSKTRTLLMLDAMTTIPIVILFILISAVIEPEAIIRFLLLAVHLSSPMAALDMMRVAYNLIASPDLDDSWRLRVPSQDSVFWIVGPLVSFIFELGSAIDFGLHSALLIHKEEHRECDNECILSYGGMVFSLYLAALSLTYLIIMTMGYLRARQVHKV